jgi:hypothetical protein
LRLVQRALQPITRCEARILASNVGERQCAALYDLGPIRRPVVHVITGPKLQEDGLGEFNAGKDGRPESGRVSDGRRFRPARHEGTRRET